MGYSLRAEEHPVSGLRRVAREQLDAAIAALGELDGTGGGESIHRIRKSLKKSRAVLKLVRRELGKDLYRAESSRMRSVARPLSDPRDADVMIATLTELDVPAPAKLEDALRRERERAYASLAAEDEITTRLASELVEARGRVDAWPLGRADAKLFRKDVKKNYKRGQSAFEDAYADPSPAAFHELRKRVKTLWYFTRILKRAGGEELGAFERWADEAADLLGLDHDLAVLRDKLAEYGPRAGNRDERAAVEEAVEQRRLELESKALPLLRRVFAESAGSFAARLAGRFDSWRDDQEALPLRRLTQERAAAARKALVLKQAADASEQRRIRQTLRAWGIEPSGLARWTANRSALEAADLDDLISREIIAVGATAADGHGRRPDALRDVAVEIGPNEASGICPIESEEVLGRLGWAQGFWVILDEIPVSGGSVAVGRRVDDDVWEARALPTASSGPETEDGEDCVRVAGWVYVFGSHYGSKEGPLEPERQFVARFRESDAFGPEPVRLEVARTDFRLHRLLNDALADSGVQLWPLAHDARSALVERTAAEVDDPPEGRRVYPGDQPINIEGVAVRSNGGVLLGLRYPVTDDGSPLMVEVDRIGDLFSDGLPQPKGVWVIEGVGNRFVPAGIRGLGEGADGCLEALTGNLDSVGKGSALVDAHPEAGRAQSAHFRIDLPLNRRSGPAAAEFVREFPGERRVEGVAFDDLGRTFYVIDEEAEVGLSYCEPVG